MQNDAYRLNINLGKKRQNDVGGIFFKWAISRGRVIVIAVELLALGALGYRFFIDQQIVDLSDQIKKQQIFIEAQAQKERQYRNIQSRIATIESITSESQTKVQFLEDMLNTASGSALLSSSFNLTDNTVSIDGQAGSVFALNSFVENIKKNPNVSSISMEELSTLDQGVRFRITISLKGKENA